MPADLTPIRVRGKKRIKGQSPARENKASVDRRCRRLVDGRQSARNQSSRRHRRQLSPLESLPTELLEQIFLTALEPNMAIASPVIAAAVSREPVYHALIMAAFWEPPRRVISLAETLVRDDILSPEICRWFRPLRLELLPSRDRAWRSRLQDAVLRCRWFTLDRFMVTFPSLIRAAISWTLEYTTLLMELLSSSTSLDFNRNTWPAVKLDSEEEARMAAWIGECFVQRQNLSDEDFLEKSHVCFYGRLFSPVYHKNSSGGCATRRKVEQGLARINLTNSCYFDGSIRLELNDDPSFHFLLTPRLLLAMPASRLASPFTSARINFLRAFAPFMTAGPPPFLGSIDDRLGLHDSIDRENTIQAIHDSIKMLNPRSLEALLPYDFWAYSLENPTPGQWGDGIITEWIYELPAHVFVDVVLYTDGNDAVTIELLRLLISWAPLSVPDESSVITTWAVRRREHEDGFATWLLNFMLELPSLRCHRSRALPNYISRELKLGENGWGFEGPLWKGSFSWG